MWHYMRFIILSTNSPTLWKLKISFIEKRMLKFFPIALIKLIWDNESLPSMSSAVVLSDKEIQSLSKTSLNISVICFKISSFLLWMLLFYFWFHCYYNFATLNIYLITHYKIVLVYNSNILFIIYFSRHFRQFWRPGATLVLS